MNRFFNFAAIAALALSALALGQGAFAPADGAYYVSAASGRLSGETLSPTSSSETLAAAATEITVPAGSTYHIVTGDGGANTVATIAGGVAGFCVAFEFVDALVTLTDTDAHTAETVDLTGAATNQVSADDLIVELCYNGTSWYQVGESQG